MLASEENLLGLMALNRELVGQAEAFDDSERVVLDDLVAWIIPKDALSSCFSTQGIT